MRLFKKWMLSGRPVDGILLIRDDDQDTSRRTGLEQARDAERDLHHRIVIGLAHCKRECWVLAGYDPSDAQEETRLVRIRAELGFDPRTSAHHLTARHDTDKRSAKRIVGLLTEDNPDREAHCWEQAPLITLLERGRETGLADYLDQVRSRLVPLFADRVPE